MKEINLNDLDKILAIWYNDGFSTWSYRDANDGVDGMFGGSFHDMGELHKIDEYNCRIWIDFGSADKELAIRELNNRLKGFGLCACVGGEIVVISAIDRPENEDLYWAKEENGKGAIYCSEFINGKYPIFVEKDYTTALIQVEKLNKGDIM